MRTTTVSDFSFLATHYNYWRIRSLPTSTTPPQDVGRAVVLFLYQPDETKQEQNLEIEYRIEYVYATLVLLNSLLHPLHISLACPSSTQAK